MKLIFPSSTFDWGQSPPLSSFKAVSTTSFLYVSCVILSTVISSRKLIPPSVQPDDSRSTPPTTRKSTSRSSQSNNKSPTAFGAKMTDLHWKPWFGSDLKRVQMIHNINLVVGSAIMLGGVVVESLRRGGMSSSPQFLFCEVADGIPAQGPLYFWSYIYYISKYYELLDTFLQLARGKPPPHFILHVYHHASVLFMAWAWLEYKQSLQFIGLAWNTAVHVVMYTYFLQRTITCKVPRWKSFVTIFQIAQFTFSMVVFLVTLCMVFVQGHECAGMGALYGNFLFNATLLYSFVGVLLFHGGRKKKR